MGRRRKRPARRDQSLEGLFRSGQRVVVKPGVVSPLLPGINLSGWPGVIRNVDPDGDELSYLVEFPAGPLAAAGALYREACDQGNLEYGLLLMSGAELEAARPALPALPTDRPARVRQVLGVPTDSPLPGLSLEALVRFHDYLFQTVDLPAAALLRDNHPVLLMRILPPEEDYPGGLQCEVIDRNACLQVPVTELLELPEEPAAKAVSDYQFWFFQLGSRPARVGPSVRGMLGMMALVFIGAGAALGALLATVNEARLAAQVGAGVLGILGGWFASRYERIFRAVNKLRSGFLTGFVLGFLAAGAAGAVLGALAVGFVGTIPGAIAGTILGSLLGERWGGKLLWTGVGTVAGALTLAAYRDQGQALLGAAIGGLVGLLAGAGLAVAVVMYLSYLGVRGD